MCYRCVIELGSSIPLFNGWGFRTEKVLIPCSWMFVHGFLFSIVWTCHYPQGAHILLWKYPGPCRSCKAVSASHTHSKNKKQVVNLLLSTDTCPGNFPALVPHSLKNVLMTLLYGPISVHSSLRGNKKPLSVYVVRYENDRYHIGLWIPVECHISSCSQCCLEEALGDHHISLISHRSGSDAGENDDNSDGVLNHTQAVWLVRQEDVKPHQNRQVVAFSRAILLYYG